MMYTEQQWEDAEKLVYTYLDTRFPEASIKINRWEVTEVVAAFITHSIDRQDREEFYMRDLVKGNVVEKWRMQ